MKNDELIAKTPLGEIVVGVKSDPDHPGVYIELHGSNLNDRFESGTVRLAWVEYSSEKGCIQTIVYGDGDADDFSHLIEHEQILRVNSASNSSQASRALDREFLAELCDTRDARCSFCERNDREKCIVTHLIDGAHNAVQDDDDGSYSAFVYEEDGVTAHDLATYYSKDEAVRFAKNRGWDEVVDDTTGEVVWRK